MPKVVADAAELATPMSKLAAPTSNVAGEGSQVHKQQMSGGQVPALCGCKSLKICLFAHLRAGSSGKASTMLLPQTPVKGGWASQRSGECDASIKCDASTKHS